MTRFEFPVRVYYEDTDAAGVVYYANHRAEIDFLAPARLNDYLDVTVEAVEQGAVRLVVAQEVRRDDVVITQARVALACVDTARWKPVRMPKPLQHALETTT